MLDFFSLIGNMDTQWVVNYNLILHPILMGKVSFELELIRIQNARL